MGRASSHQLIQMEIEHEAEKTRKNKGEMIRMVREEKVKSVNFVVL